MLWLRSRQEREHPEWSEHGWAGGTSHSITPLPSTADHLPAFPQATGITKARDLKALYCW